MPFTTGDYPMPYPGTGVAPDGPGAFLDLAQAADDALSGALPPLDARVEQLETAQTVYVRTSGTLASTASYLALPIGTSLVGGTAWTHSSGVFTCVTGGDYRVKLNISYASNATGIRGCRLVGTGTPGTRTAHAPTANSGTDTTLTVEIISTCAPGDTITAQYLQNSGGTLTVLADLSFERIV